ncbi:aldose epimerase family protein [Serratia entomophila]|uniref:aldose epimerase family protein n=1 Tax=Serratia entomophila TaxID=42906 RepID=UPI00217A161C|nr:hypothetical protein [Serratia entomophila]CAI1040250.1 Aldose 1-epimerase [Serratia entomophila]CAI1719353.1 Aldose 1-epimerase [Serratia entomophila]CAI1783246.1 Aldose 1-epimerase [Serratia entomophila]CAI1837489.1 Aldose 1-epimerase [Serratia entomophila]CAI1848054.1 Aldose 1-epimerase [Serratia entomophila]
MGASWTLENARLKLRVAALGAEMISLRSKAAAREWLWRPRQAAWQSVSPILFPVVGRLIHGGLWEEGQFYPLPAHGFLRHQQFSLVAQTAETLTVRAGSNAATRAQWPFEFGFEACWRLMENGVHIAYRVENTGARRFGFSLGSHPGFAVPIARRAGWRVVFSEPGVGGPFPTRERTLEVPANGARLTVFALSSDTFEQGAVYFSGCCRQTLSLVSPDHETVLQVRLGEHPWLALWSVPGQALLCIEPLDGTTDAPDFSGQLAEKRGMRWLEPGGSYRQGYEIVLNPDVRS